MKNTREPIRSVGLLANTEKPLSRAVVRQAAALIRRSGRVARVDAATAAFAGLRLPVYDSVSALARAVDLLVVFGGDGTMLRVARDLGGARTPLLGINVGSLGFLTAVPSRQLAAALGQVWQGEFQVDQRRMMEATGQVGGKPLAQSALNDLVISRGAASRMIELEVRVDDEELTRYRCDGLIVSSATGSTAYSLSAGGAIVSPAAEVFTLTPICPHTLSNRSVILSLRSTIRVKVISHKPETLLAADGQVEMPMRAGDEVVVRRSRHCLRLVRLTGNSFFRTLRQKLNWSGSNI